MLGVVVFCLFFEGTYWWPLCFKVTGSNLNIAVKGVNIFVVDVETNQIII